MRAWAPAVLALVFLDELAAISAYGVWGYQHPPRWVLVLLLLLVAAVVWGLFAAPRARFGRDRVGTVARPVVKVVVFGLAVLALDSAGHAVWALALLVGPALVNALASTPGVRRVADEMG